MELTAEKSQGMAAAPFGLRNHATTGTREIDGLSNLAWLKLNAKQWTLGAPAWGRALVSNPPWTLGAPAWGRALVSNPPLLLTLRAPIDASAI